MNLGRAALPHEGRRSNATSSGEASGVLGSVELPSDHADVVLSSGRRVELRTARGADHITVRAPGGRVVVRLGVTERGARLELDGDDLELATPGKLTFAAEDIELRAQRDLALHAGRDVTERVAGSRHARIEQAERVEAGQIELQANTEAVRVRAIEHIALDGEHIGLNDDPCPQPFPWSAIADGPSAAPEGERRS
ncbi:MAG: hypothetical protein JRI23_13350 [Deltaproteobacteria bacterium]|nr:hypothetical protein [Deltaproteobacteria bacterium]MBW2532710.1 hypothetical protein [Deltaproteobacteria bacterium]